jgi:Tol biopolymer transport system component
VALAAGSRLGPYEILGQIGAGGMGEVYRAKDPRLGREVAIKVLPASFSQDADRLRRFEQEAKAAGVLNHPNITAVYDIGSHDGAPYVVQELLEGETLRSELAGGRLSPRKAIDRALQIAHGLAAAHEKGIVHRDLKPENLFVTRDGRVKILDFGLAKLTHQEEGSQATNLPTATAGTEPGVVLGTLGYMSPEQVRGRSADARSDIFSFGAILYEMLSGRRAFHGDSAADTMSAILKEDPPDLSVTNQNISPGLERIVRHCLEKNPEQRFHSAHDLAFDLEALSGTSATSAGGVATQTGRPAPRIGRPWLVALAFGALAAGAVASHLLWRPSGPTTPTYQRLTFRRGNIGTARFAPDGRSVVFSASWEGQPLEIYTTRPEGPEAMPAGLKNTNLFAVSHSGELAVSLRDRFLAGPAGIGTLATVPLGGGAPRPIAEFVEYADWTPDGKQLVATRFLEGRNRLELPLGKVLAASEHDAFLNIRFSPKGDRIAAAEGGRAGRRLVSIDLAGKIETLVKSDIRGQGLAWSPSGQEVWFDDRGERGQYLIKAVDLSGHVRTLASTPVGTLIHDVARDGRVLVERYSGRRGILGLFPGETRERDLSWFDGSRPIAMSDDGGLLLFDEIGDAASGSGSHYVRKTDGSPAVNLGPGGALDLSPDGKWVLVRSQDAPKVLTLQPTGTGAPISIDFGAFESVGGGATFFPDGKRLLVALTEQGKEPGLYVQDIPSGKPRLITSKRYGTTGRPVSPDGLWVAAYGEWTEDVFLLPTSGGEPRSIPNTKDVDIVRWTADGKALFAVETGSIPARVVRIDVATGRREQWKSLAPPELAGLISISRVLLTQDGKWYAYGSANASISDLYLVEGLK